MAGFLSLSQTGQSFGLFKPNGTGVAKKSPRAEGGRGEVNSPLLLSNSNTQTTRVGGFFYAFWSLLGSLLAHFWSPLAPFWFPFAYFWCIFSPPMSRKPADFSLPISLLQVAGVPGVRRCRSASTMIFQCFLYSFFDTYF